MIKIVETACEQRSCFCYLVVAENREAVMIDPGILWSVDEQPVEGLERLRAELARAEITLREIFLTHTHYDHCAAASLVSRSFGVPVFISPEDEHILSTDLTVPKTNTMDSLARVWGRQDVERVENLQIDERTFLTIGSYRFQIIAVPGHTPGHRILYEQQQQILFSGDFILPREGYRLNNQTNETSLAPGRTDLPGGSLRTLCESYKRVFPIVSNARVIYTGHGTVHLRTTHYLTQLAQELNDH